MMGDNDIQAADAPAASRVDKYPSLAVARVGVLSRISERAHQTLFPKDTSDSFRSGTIVASPAATIVQRKFGSIERMTRRDLLHNYLPHLTNQFQDREGLSQSRANQEYMASLEFLRDDLNDQLIEPATEFQCSEKTVGVEIRPLSPPHQPDNISTYAAVLPQKCLEFQQDGIRWELHVKLSMTACALEDTRARSSSKVWYNLCASPHNLETSSASNKQKAKMLDLLEKSSVRALNRARRAFRCAVEDIHNFDDGNFGAQINPEDWIDYSGRISVSFADNNDEEIRQLIFELMQNHGRISDPDQLHDKTTKNALSQFIGFVREVRRNQNKIEIADIEVPEHLPDITGIYHEGRDVQNHVLRLTGLARRHFQSPLRKEKNGDVLHERMSAFSAARPLSAYIANEVANRFT